MLGRIILIISEVQPEDVCKELNRVFDKQKYYQRCQYTLNMFSFKREAEQATSTGTHQLYCINP